MNIKSLLLGSAAALVAVSGARAADAVEVVAEPEPAEYVRVCDTYGTGYFYIPGTETCLRIGGYLRYDIAGGNGLYGGHETVDRLDQVEDDVVNSNDTYHKQARLSLQTWTGTETELGTLSTYTETRFNYSDGNAGGSWATRGDVDSDVLSDWVFGDDDEEVHGAGSSVSLNFAWIQLGGFRVGKDETAFMTFSGYAGGVIADDIIAYGTYDTNLLSYTFDAGNGFSAIVSLETGSAGSDYEIDSYIPHVVGGVKYTGGAFTASLTGAYDSTAEEFAVKGRVDFKANEQLSIFAMAAYGSTNDDAGTFGNYNTFKTWAGDWAIWGGGSYKFSDKATLNVQASYTDGSRWDVFVNNDDDDGSEWAVAANVDYELVKDFHIIPEVSYSNLDLPEGVADRPQTDGFAGWLRFQRNF